MFQRAAAIVVLAALGTAACVPLLAQTPTDLAPYQPPATSIGGWPVAQLPPPIEALPPIEPSQPPPALGPYDPIEAPVEPGSWVLPTYWFNPVNWDGGVEIGVNGTAGNAEAVSIRTGGELKRTTDLYELTADITYLKASADGVETQHNALFNSGLERSLGDSRWSFFLKDSLEYDEFKAFDLRFAANAGLGFQFIETEKTKLKGRYGAGTSYEIGGPNDEWIPELVYGADFERQLTERQKLALTVDYFPEWGNFRNYRLVTDFGWEVLLDEEHNLNLKLSINDRYDSTPNGLKPNDINYALLLLWKM